MNVSELETRVNELEAELQSNLNALWTLLCALHVFFMQAGFALVEAGQCKKHLLFLILKNTMDVVIVGVTWWLLGYCLAFGADGLGAEGNTFVGFSKELVAQVPTDHATVWFFFFVYVSASATIVSGAMAERTKFVAYAMFSVFGGLIIFPVVVHWVWSSTGFMSFFSSDASLPVIDFAGSGVVHMAGGVAAFVGAKMVGPRRGVEVGRPKKNAIHDEQESIPIALTKKKSFMMNRRISVIAGMENGPLPTTDPDLASADRIGSSAAQRKKRLRSDEPETTPKSPSSHAKSHSPDLGPHAGIKLTLQALGTFILWYAWFAFNGGSTQAFTNGLEDIASLAVVNTLLGACGAAAVCLLYTRCIHGRYMVDIVLNGILGGLVSVTASCGMINTYTAVLVGGGAGLVYIAAASLVRDLGVDDPVDAAAVHGLCGMYGFLLAPLIVREHMVILFFGASSFPDGYDRWAIFGHHIAAVLIIILWVSLLSFLAFEFLRRVIFTTLRDDAFTSIDNRSGDAKKTLERQTSQQWMKDECNVCIVFTDIEGSTVLWETDPDSMDDAIDLHHMVARETLRKHNGYEIKTEGDAFMVAFANPKDALLWAMELQLEMLRAPWPRPIYSLFPGRIETEQMVLSKRKEKTEKLPNRPGGRPLDRRESVTLEEEFIDRVIYRGLRVRVGMHYERAKCKRDPTTGRMDFYGPMVNRAARIAGLARGGQTLISTEVLGSLLGVNLEYTVVQIADVSGSTGVPLSRKNDEWNGDPAAGNSRDHAPVRKLVQQGEDDLELQSASSFGLQRQRTVETMVRSDGTKMPPEELPSLTSVISEGIDEEEAATSDSAMNILKSHGLRGFDLPITGETMRAAFVGDVKVKGISESVEVWMVHPRALVGRGFSSVSA